MKKTPIKIKEKPCKGTGKAIGSGCGRMVFSRTYGLGNLCCYITWLLNTKEGKAKVARTTFKVTEPRKSLEKAEKVHKETNGIQAAFNLTKVVVHAMIRLRDEGQPCISCGCQWSKEFHAGHCFASGDYFSIRYDFDNINGQCVKCNLLKDGNESEYHLRLPNRIGVKRYQELVKRAKNDKKQAKNWIKDELKEIRKEARRITNELLKR